MKTWFQAFAFKCNLYRCSQACRSLRTLEADVGALEERRGARGGRSGVGAGGSKRGGESGGAGGGGGGGGVAAQSIYARPVGLMELLTQIFLRSGGAGPVDENGNVIATAPATAAAAAGAASGEGAAAGAGGGGGGGRGGSGGGEDDNGEVTAEMLEAREKEGDGLITQAYAALLVAFLIEGQPALRADVVCTLPEGGLASLGGAVQVESSCL
jgi:hypothetical protein